MKQSLRITGYMSEYHLLERAERRAHRTAAALVAGALLGFAWATVAAKALGF